MVGVIFSLMARLIHGRNEQGERPWQKTLLWAALHSPAGQAGPGGGWTRNQPEQVDRPGDAGTQPGGKGGKGRPCWACGITSTRGEGGRRGREHSPLLQQIPRTPLPAQSLPGGSLLRPGASDTLKPEARGVAAPSICQADSGGLSHARTLGPGDPKPPSEVGLMTCLVSDWALSEMLRDKQLQRGQASL